jgi:large subunit ribosomal protein L12
MNLIYGALLLHSAGKQVTEESIRKVADAVGENVEDAQIKALIAALEGVNIGDVISKASIQPVAVSAQPVQETKKEEIKEEDNEKKAEEAAAGLSALFG